MAVVSRTVLKSYFETGDKPTQAQFIDVFDSVFLPDEDALYTATNGLTLTGSDIELGGTLTSATTIDTDGNNFELSTATAASYLLSITDGSDVSSISIVADEQVLQTIGAATNSDILISSNGLTLSHQNVSVNSINVSENIIITDAINSKGIVNAADYSANSTARSLIDKAEIQALIAAAGGGDFEDGGEAGGADRTLGNTDNYDLGFLTNNVNRLQIQNDGYIGIGIAAPLALLHINGTPGNINQGIVFGDGDTGIYESTDDILSIWRGGTLRASFAGKRLQMEPDSGYGPCLIAEQATVTNPTIAPNIQDLDTGIGWSAADKLALIAGGRPAVQYVEASNHVIQYHSPHTGITASTTQTQGQQQLLSSYNEVSTVANANDVVTLPSAVKGYKVTIMNNGANILQIFPASGDDLGAGVNTSTTLAAGSSVTYFAISVTNWSSI